MPAKTTNTPRYRVLNGISYPKHQSVIERLKAGEDVPAEERVMVERAPGKVVSDIPEDSIPWLLKAGDIELVEEAE